MFVLTLILFNALNLDDLEWHSLLNSNLMYDFEPINHGAWCATNGGVRFFSLEDSSFTFSLTNVDGLPHNTCRALALETDEVVWVGTDKGLAVVNRPAGRVYPYEEITAPVLSLDLRFDTLAVGTSIGVFLVLTRGSPLDFTDDLEIPLAPFRNQPATKVSWFKEKLWVGSEQSLKSYNPGTQEVTSYSEGNGLPSRHILDIDPSDSLNVLTVRGLVRYSESPDAFRVFIEFQEDSPIKPTSTAQTGDTVYVTTVGSTGSYKRLFRYIESADTLDTLGFWVDVPAGIESHWARYLNHIEIDEHGRAWIGLGREDDLWGEGLLLWDQEWGVVWDGSQSFDSPGLNSNWAKHLLMDGRGNLWVSHWALGLERGVTGFCKDQFLHLYTNDSTPMNASTKVIDADSEGRVVFGSWWQSNGISRYDPQEEVWSSYWWGENSPLNTIAWLAVDPLDRVWVSHLTGQRMSVLSPEFGEVAVIDWPYDFVYTLQFDSSGTVWAATSNELVSYKPRDFEDNLSDGEFSFPVSGQTVWDIALDGKGGVWGATSAGVFHYTPEKTTWFTEVNSPLPENEVISVDRDPWGRILFLCANQGVVVYDPSALGSANPEELWQQIDPSNSPLISGFGYSWVDADRTGMVAVGTFGGGVSLFSLPAYVDSASTRVSAYPNPCYASQGIPVRFGPLDDAQSLSIYTISGEKVKEFAESDFVLIQGVKQAELDVSDLSAGLYLAAVRFPDRVERLKFLILR